MQITFLELDHTLSPFPQTVFSLRQILNLPSTLRIKTLSSHPTIPSCMTCKVMRDDARRGRSAENTTGGLHLVSHPKI